MRLENYGVSNYILGFNYWASHAGIRMWSEWNEEVIEKDLECLEKYGTKILRVFPLWSDFQPLTGSVNMGSVDKIFYRGEPIGIHDVDKSGVDPVMLDRFQTFTEIAQRHGMKLVVALVTGWMSGKMFRPEAFSNLNLITDDNVVKWQIRFVRCFVKRFRNNPAIAAWSPGNETNAMCGQEGSVGSKFYVWLNNMVSTIRAEDPTRPVIAGMHSLTMWKGEAQIGDIGELFDYTTVHPYPAFVPHCFVDSLRSMKSALHPASEAALYEDISGKPCFGEEVGTLGPMLGDADTTADYLRRVMYSTWANGYNGMLWWCAFDQSHLTYDPYDRCALERELGLFSADHTPKKAALEISDFSVFLQNRKAPLTKRKKDAVCLLSYGQDHWAVAYSTNLLAKQAGFDVSFADAESNLPNADIYLLPSLCRNGAPLRTQRALLEKVKNGAVLYISLGDAFISDFEGMTGLRIAEQSERANAGEIITKKADGMQFSLSSRRKFKLDVIDAEVLATETDGNPALTRKQYGKGVIYFLSFPMEQWLSDRPQAFDCLESRRYYEIYKTIFTPHLNRIVCAKSSPFLEITEHPISDTLCEITALSYSDAETEFEIDLSPSWQITETLNGKITANTLNYLLQTDSKGLCSFITQKK